MKHTLRSHYQDLFFEFQPYSTNNTCLILLDGLPSSNPSKKNIMLTLAHYGYASIAPRYLGTWESRGTFLDHSPSDDIQMLIDHATTTPLFDYYHQKDHNLTQMKFVILGVSFGGAVALHLAQHSTLAYQTIAVSPVVSFKHHNQDGNEEDLYNVGDFLINGFGHAYRFDPTNWQNFCDGKLFDIEPHQLQDQSDNIHIIHGTDDTSVSITSIQKFCTQTQIPLTTLEGYGHLSYSKRDPDFYTLLDTIIRPA